MNEKQTEKFMEMLNNQYKENHKNHMSLIDRYSRGLVSFDAYKEQDIEYTIIDKTLKKVIDSFLYCKHMK